MAVAVAAISLCPFPRTFSNCIALGVRAPTMDSGEDSSLHNNGCPVTSVKALSPNAPQLPQSKCNIFFQRHIFKSFVLLYLAYSVLPYQNGYVPTHGFSESSLVSALPRGSPHSRCLPPAHRSPARCFRVPPALKPHRTWPGISQTLLIITPSSSALQAGV